MIRATRAVFTALLLAHAAAAAHAQSLVAQPFSTGFDFPVAFIGDPTDLNRHFVVEKIGVIRVVVGGVRQAPPFLDIRPLISDAPERGLLGMALDPDYATNRRFYVFYTRLENPGTPCDSSTRVGCELGGLVVARYRRSAGDPLIADPSEFRLRWGSASGPDHIEHSQFSNHNGGNLLFGPDGYLYIGTGDGGGSYDPFNNAQSPNSLLGKILRIDVDVPDAHAQGYQVPPDNPFVDDTPIDALPEIWDLGMRNPWRFSFDDPTRGGTGALIIADVGQNRWEEINHEPAGQGGRNYGWRIREGAHPEFNAPPTTPAFSPLTEPMYEYSHVVGETPLQGRSITGGFVYRGSDLSASWRGRYFFGDFASARTWSAQVEAGTGAFSNIIDHTGWFGSLNISSFGVDQRGELYIVRYGSTGNGIIYRLCEVSIAGGLTSFSAAGGTGTLIITTQPGCSTTVTVGGHWMRPISDVTTNGSRTFVFRVLPNDGSPRQGTLTVAGQSATILQSSTPPIDGDVDNNGTGDLLWQHADGRTAVWLMRRQALIDARPLGPGSIADVNWRIAAAGDFNGDGSPDVLFQHQTDGRLAVWFMSGSVLLSADALTPGSVADTNWKVRGAADMDRDGWTDLIWQHQTTGAIGIWLMTGTRLRDAHPATPGTVSDLNWRIVGTGDMNADGHADLVWQHQTSGFIAVWLMNGSRQVRGILLTPEQVADTDWKVRSLADLNGDGALDLVWQNQATGLLAVWFMSGTRAVESVSLIPSAVGDLNWQIVGPR